LGDENTYVQCTTTGAGADVLSWVVDGTEIRQDKVSGLVIITALYFGDPETNGSWRTRRVSNDLVFERRESDSWVEKGSIVA
jgi:hypothetical protein